MDERMKRVKVGAFIVLKRLKRKPISQKDFTEQLSEITGLSKTLCYYWILVFVGNHVTHERNTIDNPMPPLFDRIIKSKTFNEDSDNEIHYAMNPKWYETSEGEFRHLFDKNGMVDGDDDLW